jgi:hypothetical protein
MSHFTTIQTQIKDIEALRSACEELGFPVISNAEARGYNTNKTRGDFVIRLKGPYDIAVNKETNGAYGLTTDWWDGHVEKEVGKDFGTLLQLYAVHKVTRQARCKGHFVQRQPQKDGCIKLVIASV